MGRYSLEKLTLKTSNEQCYHTLINQEGTLLRRAKPCWRDMEAMLLTAPRVSLSLVHHERGSSSAKVTRVENPALMKGEWPLGTV